MVLTRMFPHLQRVVEQATPDVDVAFPKKRLFAEICSQEWASKTLEPIRAMKITLIQILSVPSKIKCDIDSEIFVHCTHRQHGFAIRRIFVGDCFEDIGPDIE
jgi:hypothetical protein